MSAHVLGMPTDKIVHLFCLSSPLDPRLFSPREVRRYNITFPRFAHLSLQKKIHSKDVNYNKFGIFRKAGENAT